MGDSNQRILAVVRLVFTLAFLVLQAVPAAGVRPYAPVRPPPELEPWRWWSCRTTGRQSDTHRVRGCEGRRSSTGV